MWTRKELKDRAKGLIRLNYWKAVLVAIVLSFVVGGVSSSGSGASALPAISGMQSAGMVSSGTYDRMNRIEHMDDLDLYEALERGGDISQIPEMWEDAGSQNGSVPMVVALAATGMIAFLVLVAMAIAIVIDVLILNPLEVGVRRFFSVNMFEKAQIRELAYGFDHSYKNVIHVMFFRDLHTFLWTLLFIIPGIVKSYEYRMIPYLLAEYPDMPKEDAFAISKQMMTGNKWKTFVLDLSFILWFIGSAFTLGLLGLFYGNPYYAQTGAVLYDALKAEKQPFAQRPAAGEPLMSQGPQEGPQE